MQRENQYKNWFTYVLDTFVKSNEKHMSKCFQKYISNSSDSNKEAHQLKSSFNI